MGVIVFEHDLEKLPSASAMADFLQSAYDHHAAELVDDVGSQITGGTVSGEHPHFYGVVNHTFEKKVNTAAAATP